MLARENYVLADVFRQPNLNWVHPQDRVRLAKLSWLLLSRGESSIAEELLGASAASKLGRDFAQFCRLDHAGLLVFPSRPEAAVELLQSLGYRCSELVPSVVVRERLARRYEIPVEQMDVKIAHGSAEAIDGQEREIELFVWSSPPWAVSTHAAQERRMEHEAHVGFRLQSSDREQLETLRSGLIGEGGFEADGGGFNPHEDADRGGTTVFYFRRREEVSGALVFRRVELKCSGDYSSLL